MKAKFGAIVTSGSGKLGGQMFSQTPSGVVMKNIGSYNTTSSPLQKKHRIITMNIMSMFSQITDERRALWDLAALRYSKIDVFGAKKSFNGFQLFNRINQSRLQNNESLISEPLPFHLPTFPQPVQVYAVKYNLVLISNLFNSDDIIEIYATAPLSSGKSSVKKRMRYVTSVTSAQLATGVDIYTAYVELFGVPVVGTNIHIGIKTTSNISYYSNKLLYSSFGTVGNPTEIVPVFRWSARTSNYNPSDGGLVWLSGLSGATWYLDQNTARVSAPTDYLPLPSYISMADRAALFNREVFNDTYVYIEVPNGNYLVRLYMAATIDGQQSVGANVMDIYAEYVIPIPNFDTYKEFGSKTLGYVETIVNVSDGTLELYFEATVGQAAFRAIEVLTIN